MIEKLEPANGEDLNVPLSQASYDNLKTLINEEQNKMMKKLGDKFEEAKSQDNALDALKNLNIDQDPDLKSCYYQIRFL